MKTKSVLAIVALFIVFANRVWAPPPLTAFTYQGRLAEAGAPVNGFYDFRLGVFDDEALGNLVGLRVDLTAVPVSNGLFTVQCDPGEGVFDGSPRWLQISVRTNAGGSLRTLTPRQRLTATPQAQFAVSALQAANLTTPLPASQIAGTLSDSQLSANIARLNTSPTFLGEVRANRFAGDGGGLTNLPAGQIAGTMSDSQLSTNIARLNTDQTFTAMNTFRSANFADGPGGMGQSGQLHVGGYAPGGDPKLVYFGDGDYVFVGENGVDDRLELKGSSVFINSGWVGIGTNQPQTALHVNGTVTANALNTSGTVMAGALSVVDVSDLHATNDMSISVTNDLKIKAGTSLNMRTKDVFISADGKITIQASGDLVLKGSAISFTDNVKAYGLTMNDHDISWRYDGYHGAGWYGAGKPFGGATPDGPVLYGYSGGGLGTVHGTATNLALFWSYSGNVGIGTTSPDALLTVNGTADKPGGGSWSTFSDERLKNVGPDFTRGLDDLARIQPVHYHYKANNPLNLPSQSEYVGVVAQQVQDAIPEAVQANQDGYLTVNNDPVIWTAVNAIKELNQKTEALNQNSEVRNQKVEDRMRKLEAENVELRKELTAMQSLLKQLASPDTLDNRPFPRFNQPVPPP